MEDMAAAAIELTDPMPGIWGWDGRLGPGQRRWRLLHRRLGGVHMNEDESAMTMDTPEVRAALNHWYNLQHWKMPAPAAPKWSIPQLAALPRWASAAMGHIATWSTPSMRALANFEWDVAPTPMGADGSRYTGAFGSGYGITPTSDKLISPGAIC